ncbi:NUDIX domain-containing protein [Patescibacteria group bacterium]|nr:NUDIX domain-containing protein [Patescibacteria group bacterium]
MDNIKYNSDDIVSHHGVAAVIKNQQGEILMQKHAKYGFWTIPVGKVKNGQSIEEGLKQEILEECNIYIEKSKEITVRNYTYNRNGNEVLVASHLFEILHYSGEVKNNEPQKHQQQIFLPLEKIKTLAYLSDLTLLYLETLGIKREAKI